MRKNEQAGSASPASASLCACVGVHVGSAARAKIEAVLGDGQASGKGLDLVRGGPPIHGISGPQRRRSEQPGAGRMGEDGQTTLLHPQAERDLWCK